MSQPVQLQTRTITGSKPGPHFLITGGVHGDEFESMSCIRRLMKAITPAMLRGKLTLVPVVNEAAFWRGHRTAEDNLDLARTCPGKPNGTITERTAHALSTLIRTADYYIDLHTGGTVFDIYPLVGYAIVDDPKVLDMQRRMSKAFNMPLIWGTYGKLNGRSLSIARDAKIPALYAEWRGAAGCDAAGVDGYFEGCLNVLGDLGMIDRTQPASVTKYVVEDNRDLAGFFQIQNPSPIAGQFTPAVKIGDVVKRGDLIGHVSDIIGDNNIEIRAQTAGLINMLHSFPKVLKDDALACIVELDRN